MKALLLVTQPVVLDFAMYVRVAHCRVLRCLLALVVAATAFSLLSLTLWSQDAAITSDKQTTSPLPRVMSDDDLVSAVNRLQAATVSDGAPLGPLHLRYELKMIDVKGKEHLGTYETWTSVDGSRTEIHTDVYSGTEVLVSGKLWVAQNGLRPLRVFEFAEERVLPKIAIERSISAPAKVKARKVNGAMLTCGGNGQSAILCFDPSTGFLVFGTVDGEVIEYSAWRKLGWRYLAGTVLITRLDKTLVEGRMTVASGTVSSDVFAVPEGAVESSVASANATNDGDNLGVIGQFAMVPLGPDTKNVGLDS